MSVIDPDRDQWQQLKSVLTDVLELPAPERPERLRQLLGHDPALFACALDMLQYYDSSTQQFDVGGTGSARAPALHEPGELPAAPGDFVGPYRIVRKLGEGGMGVVFLAEDQRLGRQVALKFLSQAAPALLANPRAQLLSESRSAALLNHSAIVTLHDVFEHGGELVAVMEYVEGRPLDQLIGGDPLPLGFALRLTAQLADALAYAHGRGIIHCDLKPENIHVLPNGSPKILDFGLARVIAGGSSDSEPSETRMFGTPGYLAPERLLGREPAAAADVYALGVVFYQLLSGTVPFRMDDQRQLFLDTIATQPPLPSTRRRGLPPAVDDLALRCLAKSPHERLQPHELTRAIAAVLLQLETSPVLQGVQSPEGASPVPAPDPDRRLRLRRNAVAAGLTVAAIAVCSGLLTSWTFNLVVERSGVFAREPLLNQMVIGLRSLVYPGVVMTAGLTALSAIQFAARALTRESGPASPVRASTALAIFVTMTIVAATVMLTGFDDITTALTARLGSASPQALAPFGPGYTGERALYRTAAALLVLALVVAWRPLARQRDPRERVPLEIRGGTLAVIVVLAVLAQAPYKLAVYNQVPVALVGEMRCYVLGENGDQARTFCPGWDVPRVRTVSRSSTAIEPCGFDENLFRLAGGRTCQSAP